MELGVICSLAPDEVLQSEFGKGAGRKVLVEKSFRKASDIFAGFDGGLG